MNAKELIIKRIKGAGMIPIQLPEINIKQVELENSLSLFIESLKIAGAEVVLLADEFEIDNFLSRNYPDTIRFVSADNWQRFSKESSLSELKLLQTVMINGILAVAENGAIWVNNTCFPHRIIPFITQHIILKVNAKEIVPTMHEAYQQISFDEVSYGIFIAGPSKTADIEQSLVIGAHGPKALTVIILQ